ncbi:MAG: phosphatidate cytidylyltransferase [Actinomycetota bacterium]|nr:phosphatidate cytidylyltransferase [Actinomycetota bacterium]
MDQQFELPPNEQEPADSGRPSGDPAEGVRIIGAAEAAEAMERGDVIARRGGDQPRYGDRPPPPPVGPRPALRFPLEAGADPTRIERPPVQPPPDPVGAPVELPHWTEPPAADVPQVSAGEDAPLHEEQAEDLDAWSSFASSSPRWRDADDSWDEDQTTFVADLAHDDESRVGALEDPDARPTHDQFFSFDDLPAQTEQRLSDATRINAPVPPGDEASPPSRGSSVAEADDVHEAGSPDETSVYAAADPAEDAQAEQQWKADEAGAAVAESSPTEARSVYNDEDETSESGEQVGASYEKPKRSSRAARRRTRDQTSEDVTGGQDAGGGRNLGRAVLVGVLLVAVFAGLMSIGPGWAMILVTLVVLLAAGELFDALRRAGYESATLFGLVGATAFPLAVYWRGLAAFPLLSVLAVAGGLVWYLAGAGGPDARVIQGMGATLLGIGWIGGLGSFAAAMLRAPDGRALLLIAAVATVGYDVGGFFVGRNRGQRRLSEASPNKTIEGLLGGMVACVVVVVIAVGALKLGPWDGLGPALALGLAAAIAAPLGDLCQSLVKRDLGLKDMGTILPEHGGVFDRFDSMLFVLPAIYYVVTLVGHRI